MESARAGSNELFIRFCVAQICFSHKVSIVSTCGSVCVSTGQHQHRHLHLLSTSGLLNHATICTQMFVAVDMTSISFSSIRAKPLNVPVVLQTAQRPEGCHLGSHIAPVVTVMSTTTRFPPRPKEGLGLLISLSYDVQAQPCESLSTQSTLKQMGGSLNGHTDFDYTNYYETLPHSRGDGTLAESDRCAH